MRAFAGLAVVSLLAPLAAPADKLSLEDRIDLTRGLMAEYANVKILVPRSKKPLEFDATTGTWDKRAWSEIAKVSGPAARTGDTVQITKLDIQADRIVLQINGGFKGGAHWYDGIQVDHGMGGVPISPNADTNAPSGTSIVLLFHKPLESVKSADIKKMLAPILDFDRHSATQVYSETLPPATQKAISEKRAVEGMDHEQVLMAMGHPPHKERYIKDGMEL